MNRRVWLASAAGLVAAGRASALGGPGQGPLAAWREGVRVRPMSDGEHHTIHTYYLTSPESPYGASVLFYGSATAEGHEGELRVQRRGCGAEQVVARGIVTEDAHRAACQQWADGGRRVAYHTARRGGGWAVAAVDPEGGPEPVALSGWQIGIGRAEAAAVPVYGPHWDPGEHRGLGLADLATGEVWGTGLTPERIRRAYPEWVERQFGDRPISVFFPVLSPDQRLVFFKVAMPAGGSFRSPGASRREGLLVYDLRADRLLSLTPRWRHPAWHPDSRHILEVGGLLIDAATGRSRQLPGAWAFPGSHPSLSPDGRLFATDTRIDRPPFDGPEGWWGVVVGDVETGDRVVVHRFDNSGGTTSWRPCHPHPVFSPDGRRVYFNVSDGRWTKLHVAEAAG